MKRSYDLDFERTNPVSDIVFPDIIKLGPRDRDYDIVTDSWSSRRSREVPEAELPILELRSLFYKDLSIKSFDEIFMEGKERENTRDYDKTLIHIGGPSVLRAIRTFTTDVNLINYRLDVQEDFSSNPAMVPAIEAFYSEMVKAKKLHHDAYEWERGGRGEVRKKDAYGRYIHRNWFNLPSSYLVINYAIEGFQKTLGNTKSQGMVELKSYLDEIRSHPIYKQWDENIGLLANGGRYAVTFEFDMRQGLNNIIELGTIPSDSKLNELLGMNPGADGEIPQIFDSELSLRYFRGLLKNDIGHVIESSLNLDFEGIPEFCKILTEHMANRLSVYATLGKVYQKYNEFGIPTCRPIIGEGEGIEIKGAVHPVVAWQSHEKGKDFVTNDYIVDSTNNVLVVTGPNDGGKTCYGKTIGFVLAAAQSGMMVPAEYVRIGKPIEEIFTHFVQQDDIEKGKGRHRNELSRARKICEIVTPDDFLLFDEPCGGTDSKSGYTDSVSLLAYTHAVGLPTIFITHLHELSETVEGGRWPEIGNIQAEIVEDGDDDGYGKLTYKIKNGRAGHSYGSRISKEEGMTPEALQMLLFTRLSTGELDPKQVRRKELIV